MPPDATPAIPRQTLGILFAIGAVTLFAIQDGISKYLATDYNAAFVIMLRYWAFALFVLAMSVNNKAGGIRQVARSKVLKVQMLRGMMLGLQIIIIVWSFANTGLAATHAVFAITPLLVIALSVPLLGEKVGWHRRGAVLAGFIGVLIIIQPGSAVFTPLIFVPLLAAMMFSCYHILTRWVSRHDSAETSFFWTGIGGAIVLTFIGPFFWDPMQNAHDWIWMAVLCITGAASHYLMINALALAEASGLQPYFFLQAVLAAAIGVAVFGEIITWPMILGAVIIITAGMYSFWREQVNAGKN